MNLVTGATSEEDPSHLYTEFGTIPGRFGGRRIGIIAPPPTNGLVHLQRLVRHDTRTGRAERYQFEPGVFRVGGVGRGPIARAQLPERIASGTHSCRAPGESIAGW